MYFTQNGFLRTEFENVFTLLFDFYENHELIVRSLAAVRKDLTRNEISEKTDIPSDGGLTKALMELEDSGFIENYLPYKGLFSNQYSNLYVQNELTMNELFKSI